MRSLLVSTYEMGRQPFGLASAAAWLRAAGASVRSVDVAKGPLDDSQLSAADLVGFHLPMHTATRLAGPIIARARGLNPWARICAFGLYAPLNAAWLRSLGVDAIFGGEFEEELTRWAAAEPIDRTGLVRRPADDPVASAGHAGPPLPRIHFLVP